MAKKDAAQKCVSHPGQQRTLLLVLAMGAIAFCAALGLLLYALGPITLRVAAGPPDGDDAQLINAMADTFAHGRAVRLLPQTVAGVEEGLALLRSSKADLAVARGDMELPSDAETVAVVRKNFVILWSPSGSVDKFAKNQHTTKIKEIAELAGRRLGIIGEAPANIELLKIILGGSGIALDKVAVTQFSQTRIEEFAHDLTIDAFMVVEPLDSKIALEAIAATARTRGEPKFLPIEASEAIAFKHPRYNSEEIPLGIFSSYPARPNDKVETISVAHLLIARKTLSEATVATFARQLFAIRQSLTRQVPGSGRLQKPDTEKDAELPVHRGAAAFIDGTERTFLDKYGDYFWFVLLGLSGVGSAAAWLRHFLKRDERAGTLLHRSMMMEMIPKVRSAVTAAELSAMQSEVNAIIQKAVECYDDGDIDEGDLPPFGLVLELFHHAIAEKSAELNARSQLPG